MCRSLLFRQGAFSKRLLMSAVRLLVFRNLFERRNCIFLLAFFFITQIWKVSALPVLSSSTWGYLKLSHSIKLYLRKVDQEKFESDVPFAIYTIQNGVEILLIVNIRSWIFNIFCNSFLFFDGTVLRCYFILNTDNANMTAKNNKYMKLICLTNYLLFSIR